MPFDGMSEVENFLRQYNERIIRLEPQTDEDKEIVKNLHQSLGDYKTHLFMILSQKQE